MRKPIKAYDKERRALTEEKSVVRYEDGFWLYHGAWVDSETGKVKILISSRKTGKMRLVHDRHRKEIELEYTVD